MRPRECSVRESLLWKAEPAHSDGAADADSEYEAQQLNEGHRRIRHPGLQMLRRELAHPDRQRHPRQERHERCERDDIGRCPEPEIGDDGGAEARSDRR